MALPSSIWLKREGNDDWIPLTSVTDFLLGWRLVPDDWYRDAPPNWSPGTGEAENGGAGAVQTATLPVYLPEGVAMPTTTYAGIAGAVPDEVSHVAPRMRYVVREGYYVAWNSASIPAVVQPTSRAVMFSAATTDICTVVMSATFTSVAATDITTSAAHGLITGDFVTVSNSGGGLPGGLAVSTVYKVVVLTDSTFQFYDTSDTLVNITSAGTGTHTWTRLATTHGFITGDVVSIAKNGNTLTGVTESVRYVVLSLSASTFKLMTEAGALVDITAVTAGTVYTMALISTQQRPDNLPSGIAWYPMPCDIATADPRA